MPWGAPGTGEGQTYLAECPIGNGFSVNRGENEAREEEKTLLHKGETSYRESPLKKYSREESEEAEEESELG